MVHRLSPTYSQVDNRFFSSHADGMDVTLFILTLVACGISCGNAVVSAWYARKNNVRELRAEVDEVLNLADRMARETTRARMQRVRAAANDTPTPGPGTAPSQLKLPVEQAVTNRELKAQLRSRMNIV